MVGFAGLGDGLVPFRVIQGIGEILGLQADTATLAVGDAALACVVGDVIAGIELNARAIGEDAHLAAGDGVREGGAGVGVNFPVVVVAALEVQRIVVCVDVLTDGLCLPEVHGGTLYLAQFAGGNALGIIRGEVTAGEAQELVHGVELFMACQVEVAVVGQVEDGVLIAGGFIFNVQRTSGVQRVGHHDAGLAGETLVAIGAFQTEGNGLSTVEIHMPQAQMEEVGAAVEVVGVFVGGELDGLAIDAKGSTLDAVCISAHGGTEEAVAGGVAFCAVVAQDHVCGGAILVGNDQGNEGSTIICNFCHQSTTRYGVQMGFLTGEGKTKRFLHIQAPFIFASKREMLEMGFFL